MNRNIETFIGCECEYSEATTVVFGAPFDGTTSFRPGTRFASKVMRSESYGLESYSPYQDVDLYDLSIYDGGDLDIPFGNTTKALDMIEEYTAKVLNDGKTPLMIGGEHLVTLGAFKSIFNTLHATAVEVPDVSYCGDNSFISIPTILFNFLNSSIPFISSLNVIPPASGVPVPGNIDGSRTSKSIVI